ncbi:bone morphogenetic protein receptor type-2-like isoform X2 [Stegostoma tigrinum]|uniref:bone morphogenetic protein receptor type-2-like isoform X2 n=1 Tax=Stegostoma tigrinum TaxID=3053191 RepID=UPI00286FFFDF|nr:bone morphogenetic protein receptor type-2-like isoform X2 [Stegostoma tigrinum]
MFSRREETLIVALLLLPRPSEGGARPGRICISFRRSQDGGRGLGNETVRCDGHSYCFGIWRVNSHGDVEPDHQGCWPPSHVLSCNTSCTDTPGKSHPFYSCCCNTDLCNAVPPRLAARPPRTPKRVRKQLRGCFLSHSTSPQIEKGNELPVELIEVIGQGRFGTVWKGLRAQTVVAAKEFHARHRQQFHTEMGLISLPLMEQGNILRFIDAGVKRSGEAVRYFLVTEYHQQGSLHRYLTRNCSEWAQSVLLAQSLSAGLSFLHTELWLRGEYKPVIVHRDLTSHNVLVKEDGTCAIADFGEAIALGRGAYQEGCAALDRLYTVGTHRYMAPEILDGSIDLKDKTSNLKQADVYSLALILWEIFTRCAELSPDGSKLDFKAAFEEEAGINPTFEEMVTLVLKQRERPKLPSIWNQQQPWLSETLQESWDHDPDSRLTAHCVEQRLRTVAGETLWANSGSAAGDGAGEQG